MWPQCLKKAVRKNPATTGQYLLLLCPVRSWSILSSIILWVTWMRIMYLSTTSMDSPGPLMWKPANYNIQTPSQKLRPWQTDWCIIAGLLQGIWYGPAQTSPQEIRSLRNPWTTDQMNRILALRKNSDSCCYWYTVFSSDCNIRSSTWHRPGTTNVLTVHQWHWSSNNLRIWTVCRWQRPIWGC